MTAIPPRADLRTLAAEAMAEVTTLRAEIGQYAVARIVRNRSVKKTDSELLAAWQERDQVEVDRLKSTIDGRLDRIGAALASVAAAAPPDGLSAPVPAETASEVPEGGMGACDRCTGLFLPGDKIAYDADGQYHAEHFPAVPEEAYGQRAGEGDALTYAEMESERDRLARELYFAQTELVVLKAKRDDARDGTRRAWLELEHWRTVIVPELMEQRDRLGTDRDRLAYQVEQVRAIHTEFDGRCAECVNYCDCIDRVTELGDDVEVAAAMRMCEHGNKPWPCPTIAAVDALSDDGTQPCPTPSDAKSGLVPLADVLDALRDEDAYHRWRKALTGARPEYPPLTTRHHLADYLAERFAPTTAPEGADERNGYGHG